MKKKPVFFFLAFSFATLPLSCDDDENPCTQSSVDSCYLDVGCDDTQTCSLTTDEMNALCVCLQGIQCDQPWFHEYCDDAPYEEGECGSCDDDVDGGL